MSHNIFRSLGGLLAGSVFGMGLAVSNMTNPEKILSFLNIVDRWDPSLLVVMGSALLVSFVGYRLIGDAPLFDTKFHLPTRKDIDAQLLTGSAIFGIGWGLGGFCPGPAIAGLSSGAAYVYVFVAAIVVGGQLPKLFNRSSPQDE